MQKTIKKLREEFIPKRIERAIENLEEKIKLGTFPSEFDVGPDDPIKVMPGPEFIEILVAGDPGRNRIKTLDSGYTRVTTKEIKLPSNWDSLPKT